MAFLDDTPADSPKTMLDEQLRARGIRDPRVLAAMEAVPRELFVLPARRRVAYADRAQPILAGQTISQPYIVAKTCELAALRGDEHVLEVGAGSGYQAAVLARLCRDVVTIERIEELVSYARAALAEAGIDNVEVVHGDGSLGHAARAPYDAIVVAAAAPTVPQALVEQLADGGRLVIPVGGRELQTLLVLEKRGAELVETAADPCVFVPLLGAAGWGQATGV